MQQLTQTNNLSNHAALSIQQQFNRLDNFSQRPIASQANFGDYNFFIVFEIFVLSLGQVQNYQQSMYSFNSYFNQDPRTRSMQVKTELELIK